CNPDGAEIPVDNTLDRLTGSDPSVTDYILASAAKCPNCRREILERLSLSRPNVAMVHIEPRIPFGSSPRRCCLLRRTPGGFVALRTPQKPVSALRKQFPHLPDDYFSFLLQSDGGEGFVGIEPGYFALGIAPSVITASIGPHPTLDLAFLFPHSGN